MIECDKIIAVIEKDATGYRKLKDNSGHYCVIGGLLHEIGMEPVLYQLYPDVPELNALHQVYGLDKSAIAVLMSTNDSYSKTMQRREELIKVVNDWRNSEV